MMRLLSLAWWGQSISSAPMIAGAIAVAVTVLVASVAGGAVWLHHEGASAERARCSVENARAKSKADAEMLARLRASEEVAARRRRELLDELTEQRLRMEELEVALAATPKAVCYPKDIARRLNDGRR